MIILFDWPGPRASNPESRTVPFWIDVSASQPGILLSESSIDLKIVGKQKLLQRLLRSPKSQKHFFLRFFTIFKDNRDADVDVESSKIKKSFIFPIVFVVTARNWFPIGLLWSQLFFLSFRKGLKSKEAQLTELSSCFSSNSVFKVCGRYKLKALFTAVGSF